MDETQEQRPGVGRAPNLEAPIYPQASIREYEPRADLERIAGKGGSCDISGRRVVWLERDVVATALVRVLEADEP